MNRRSRSRVVAVLLAATLVLTLVGGLLSATGNPTRTGDDATTQTTVSPPVTQASDLAPIAYTELPTEGQNTLQLIGAGGPYPHDRDGVVFENREGLLPDEPRGYYREYTVPTPGESGRGARRIIVGGDRVVAYYTDDHYESFREVVNG